jgi:hypothetical protein
MFIVTEHSKILNKKSVATATDFRLKDFLTPPPTPSVGGNHSYLSDRKRA